MTTKKAASAHTDAVEQSTRTEIRAHFNSHHGVAVMGEVK